jgi:signal transduction histidine kinase
MVMFSYRNLTMYYSARGDYPSFLNAFERLNAVRDSIFSAQVNNSIAEMQVKYETEAKEKENALQKLEINRQRDLRNSFIFITVLILILVVILFNRYRIKRRQSAVLEAMVEARTAELRQSEQRVLRTTIETEERERARFSGDLHDGLGPLLSTVKIHLELIRSRGGNQEEQEKYIKMAGELLDEAIRSTREIANDLVPNILNDFGLIEALGAYIEKINRLGAIQIAFTTSGMEIRPGKEIEKATYRIALELINNTLKHAGATVISISLAEREQKLIFDYSDNGRGMAPPGDPMKSPSTGLGIPNIISRIKSLNGSYDLESTPGKSFRIQIKVPLTHLQMETSNNR